MGTLGTVAAKAANDDGSKEKAQIIYDEGSIYGSKFAAEELPEFEMADGPCPAKTTYQLIKDELDLDGKPSLNLASFVTTFMEEEAEKLMMENLSKNYIDVEEYESTADIQNRCVNMIGRLFNAPTNDPHAESIGVSTIGSSEAIILATLAMKRRWQNARKAAGKDYSKPNLVMNAAVQVCWEKATRYLEIEEKYVYCTEERYVIDPKEAVALCDENTIGVVGILGTTYTGEYEDIETLSNLLDELQKEKGLDINIHVDAASGGMVAPFVNPELKWDFRLPRVISINTSGHKYGMTYAGIGWALWRSKEYLPEELVFHVSYLGADQASFTLNFSKSAVQVIGQYYVLVRYGKSGFRSIMQNITEIADYLASQVEEMGRFKILTPGHGKSLPLVAFKLKESKHYDEFAIAAHLRQRGWIVPAYSMAPHAENMKLLRVVVRTDMSRSRCNVLLRDLHATCEFLDSQSATTIKALVGDQSQHKEVKKKARKGHVHMKDNHSLQGKHKKTHAVC